MENLEKWAFSLDGENWSAFIYASDVEAEQEGLLACQEANGSVFYIGKCVKVDFGTYFTIDAQDVLDYATTDIDTDGFDDIAADLREVMLTKEQVGFLQKLVDDAMLTWLKQFSCIYCVTTDIETIPCSTEKGEE